MEPRQLRPDLAHLEGTQNRRITRTEQAGDRRDFGGRGLPGGGHADHGVFAGTIVAQFERRWPILDDQTLGSCLVIVGTADSAGSSLEVTVAREVQGVEATIATVDVGTGTYVLQVARARFPAGSIAIMRVSDHGNGEAENLTGSLLWL